MVIQNIVGCGGSMLRKGIAQFVACQGVVVATGL